VVRQRQHDYCTLFDAETRRKIDDNDPETPAISFFTARTPSGRIYDYRQLVDWKLPVVRLIRSPSTSASKWSLKEIMDMWDQPQGKIIVGDSKQEFAIPPMVEFAGQQLCGVRDSYDKHPIEGVAVSFGPCVIKVKNPFYADKEEIAEEKAARVCRVIDA